MDNIMQIAYLILFRPERCCTKKSIKLRCSLQCRSEMGLTIANLRILHLSSPKSAN